MDQFRSQLEQYNMNGGVYNFTSQFIMYETVCLDS